MANSDTDRVADSNPGRSECLETHPGRGMKNCRKEYRHGSDCKPHELHSTDSEKSCGTPIRKVVSRLSAGFVKTPAGWVRLRDQFPRPCSQDISCGSGHAARRYSLHSPPNYK